MLEGSGLFQVDKLYVDARGLDSCNYRPLVHPQDMFSVIIYDGCTEAGARSLYYLYSSPFFVGSTLRNFLELTEGTY